MLAQVVFRATELLRLISPPGCGLCAKMIESSTPKVVIRGYGETVAAKTNSPICEISHLSASRESCLLP